MKKGVSVFLLIFLGCATTAYKIKSPRQEYFDITIKPLKTTLTVDEDIPVAVNIKNISPHTIVLPNSAAATFQATNLEDKSCVVYHDLKYSSMMFLYSRGPLPNATWHVNLTRISLCPQAEIIDTILLKSYKYLKPGKYKWELSLYYSAYRHKALLKSVSEEFINIVDK